MKQYFKNIKIKISDIGRYAQVVNHVIPYLILPTSVGKVFFTHSKEDGSPDPKMLNLFNSMLKSGKADKIVVCYPDEIAKSKEFRHLLKYHLMPNGRGPLRTHDNNAAARAGYPTTVSGNRISVLLSVKK
jgi:hypothetical protein